MTYVPSVGAGTSQVPATQPAAPDSAGNPLNQLDNSQTFLQLLVAQLKNQDPLNPTDPTSFMTEIAQLTAVQSQSSLAAEEQTVAADSMIGRDVTGIALDGTHVTGLVSGVVLNASGGPTLDVGGAQVTLSSVTRVDASSSGVPPDAGGAQDTGGASGAVAGTD